MKTSTRIISTVSILILGISLVIGGCQTSKKPMNPTTPAKRPQVTSPATPSYQTQTAKRVSAEATKVAGVTAAYTVVSSKNIYIGLGLSGMGTGTNSAQVEKMVVDRVKKMEFGYSVYATSDKNTVASIKNIADDIAGGKPLSSFKTQLNNIDQRIKSSTLK